ncbi:hypothetical protein ROHU_024533 [Labeo rohita]|uniref:Uncharacterized protein n=1 Tax=Labeo rohita TaxID=84645 RepID=A0A498MIT2_LABRO|nr:hypothetical protein ROHU_024533 [Labeo rohita]
MKSLCCTLAYQASLSGQDPLMSASPSPVELPTMAALSWGEQLDTYALLPSVLSMDKEEEEDALEFKEERQSDFLLSEEEEDFKDSPFIPPVQLAQPLTTAGSTEEADGAPSSLLLSVDLQMRCGET